MTDLLKAFAGKSAFLFTWTFAAAIAIGAAALFLVPTALHLGVGQFVNGWTETTRDLVLVAAVLLVGFLMSSLSTPLYRILEGYAWPRPLRNWGSGRQRRRKRCLSAELNEQGLTLLEKALLWEKLARYPADDGQVAPTQLGNATRAFETYGVDRYQLDSQTFWNELLALAPKNLQEELDNSRASTDFLVAMVYLTALYGLAALALAVAKLYGNQGYDIPLIAQGAVLVILGPAVAYRLAISSTTYWASTVQAMVNLGRMGLAKKAGLVMPPTLAGERDMWTAFSQLVFYPFDQAHPPNIDSFRAEQAALPGVGGPAAPPQPGAGPGGLQPAAGVVGGAAAAPAHPVQPVLGPGGWQPPGGGEGAPGPAAHQPGGPAPQQHPPATGG